MYKVAFVLIFISAFFAFVSPTQAAAWDGLFDWVLATELYPAVRYTQYSAQSPRPVVINAIRVDLHAPNVSFYSTPRADNWGQPAANYTDFTVRTERQTTANFLTQSRNAGINMVAAINAAPWQPWAQLPDFNLFGWDKAKYPYAASLGLAVSAGQLVSFANNTPSLLIYQDRSVSFSITDGATDYSQVDTAVSGFDFVLINGNPSGGTALAPRTGYGLSQDQRYLILITIDGRQDGFSEGAGTIEVGHWLKYFGAWSGINMDGGGSTTMALADPLSGSVSIVNSPSDSYSVILYGARRVGNNLGIVIEQTFLSADINGDGVVDLHDFVVIEKYWLNDDCMNLQWCGGADLDMNGIVDIQDLLIFVSSWLEDNG